MKHSRLSQENSIFTTGLLQTGLETFAVPLQLTMTSERAPGRINPRPPFQPVSERFPALEKHEVTLTFFAPGAREVNVAGDFNGWRPKAARLKKTGAGEWLLRLRLRSGQYEYRFLADGRWSEDPRASKRVAGPRGGFNSVLTVPLAVKTSIL